MIQTHQKLIELSEEYNTLFSKNEFYPLQKAYSTPHFLVLVVRFHRQTKAIYIGRGHGYEGIFLSSTLPPSYLRVQDKLLDYVRKELVGVRLGKLKVYESFLLAEFGYKAEHSDKSFSFGYKNHQLYFLKRDKENVYCGWSGEIRSTSKLENTLFDFLGDKPFKEESKEKSLTVEDYLESEEKKIKGKPLQKKKEKFLDRKIKNIIQDLKQVECWPLLENNLLSDQLNLNLDKLVFQSHKISFEGALTPWQKKDVVFKKIKKLKRAEGILKERLAETSEELSRVLQGNFEFEVTREKIIQPLWYSGAVKKFTSESYSFLEITIHNIRGIISLDAKSNDWIRSNAAKNHWWFHIDQYSGAHLILKEEDISKLTQSDYSAIASCLRDFSKLNIDSIPLVFSQVKNIKGLKGAQGNVIINKPKYLQCHYNNWKEIITLL